MKILPWVMPEEPEILQNIFKEYGALKTYEKGSFLNHGGEDGMVYLIVSGMVTFGFLDITNRYQIMSIVLPGRSVGDLDSLDTTPCGIIAEVLKPVELYWMPRSVWVCEIRKNIDLMQAYAQSANYKHQCAMQGMVANYTWPLEDRLRLLFYSLITAHYPIKAKGWNPLPVKLNNTELSTIVSVNRSWVSRTLSRWFETGLAKKDGRVLLLSSELFSDFSKMLSIGKIFRQDPDPSCRR